MGEKIIGILGGMGPEATADLYHRIIRATPVEKDQDHPSTIIYSNSKVPDRTPAVLGEGESPVPEMLMAARKLEEAGADFIIMPCNTAHFFIEELRKGLGIPVINMIEITAEKTAERFPRAKKAGLIASDGTVKSGIYDGYFSEKGIEILLPPGDLQKVAMESIYDHIKTGDLEKGREKTMVVADDLVNRGADIVICGCTETSLVLKDGDLPVPVVDPLQVLAEKASKIGIGEKEI
ncbi:MAG: amino acid racemase [Candidatus Bathyarchaeota archaeon]|jgi:aspartate racemase